jgi:hypothetical protein
VTWEEFVHPSYREPLVQAYGGRFESVFVVLHPFVRVPQELAWSVTRQYPDDREIAAKGKKCGWSEVAAEVGLTSSAQTARSPENWPILLAETRFGGSSKGSRFGCRLRDVSSRCLQRDFVQVFREAGAEELIFVPEFPNSEPVSRQPIRALSQGTTPFPTSGTLVAPDASSLFTVDWDSFFTLFYGRRTFVADAARRLNLEGFFATANTEHSWWNYSMGCATVTVSPEDWQNV